MITVNRSSVRIWAIMISLTLIIVGFCLLLIYITILKNKKVDLKAQCINQQSIIRSIYKETGDRAKTLEILQEYYTNDPTFGKTGEYLIGILDHDSIRYLVEVRNPPSKGFSSLPFSTNVATPMRNALSGITGTLFGHDYRGKNVLAYTAFIPELNWGIVTKMDLKEVLGPFFKIGALIIFVTLVLIFIGHRMFTREFQPILENVKRNEARFRNLFEYSADPIWELDASGIKEYFDQLTSIGISDIPAYLDNDPGRTEHLVTKIKVLNVNHSSRIVADKEALISDPKLLYSFFNLKTAGVFRKVFTDLYSGRNRVETEVEFTISGELRSYLAHVSVLPGHEKTLGEVLILFVDITQLKEYQQKLQQSESMLKKSQEIAHLGSWELNLLNNKLYWTDEVYRIFGLEPGETAETYEAFLGAVHPDDRSRVDAAYTESVRDNLPGYEVEHRVRWKTGEVRHVLEKCNHLRDETGRIVRSSGMTLDITDRKKAETELLNSRQKLFMALQNGRIGIWEWNIGTDKLILDRRAGEMFGLDGDTGEMTFGALENLIPEQDLRHFRKAVRNSLKGASPLETVFRISTGAGASRTVSVRAMMVKGANGNPDMMSGVAFDLTEFAERTDMMISKLNEELLRSNRELEDFAYIASHDLQEPLRMVSSFTQLLAMQYAQKLDDRAREYIGFAVDGAKRMYDLLNDLLSYSRINTKGEAFSDTRLEEILEITKQNLALKISERKAVIKAGKLPVVHADRNQMTQLLQNLIANSIKFSKDEPRIFISAKCENGFHVISVKDEGIGLDPVYSARIFRIFQRLNPKGEYEGTGVGLAICKRIVERHGGTITVQSQPGEGATFIFTIPERREKG